MLGTTTLHNGMILSTLSISSHGFAFGFPERPHTNGDVFLTYKPMIIPLISHCRTPSQQSSANKNDQICKLSYYCSQLI